MQLDIAYVDSIHPAKSQHIAVQIVLDLIAVVVAPWFAQGQVPCCFAVG